MREHAMTVIKAKTKSTDNTKFWQRCRENWITHALLVGEWYSHSGIWYISFTET